MGHILLSLCGANSDCLFYYFWSLFFMVMVGQWYLWEIFLFVYFLIILCCNYFILFYFIVQYLKELTLHVGYM